MFNGHSFINSTHFTSRTIILDSFEKSSNWKVAQFAAARRFDETVYCLIHLRKWLASLFSSRDQPKFSYISWLIDFGEAEAEDCMTIEAPEMDI